MDGGTSVIDNLSQDLKNEFGTMKGFSARNLRDMKIFATEYPNLFLESNFALTLPENDSDLANEIFKDEYNFEFIDNSQGRLKEREIKKNLVDNVIKFLTELGKGLAFVGKQYHLKAGDDDYYIDLPFYHLELRSYIII